MKYVLVLSFVYLLVQYNPVKGQEICDFEDDACLTEGTNNLYMKTVAGVPCLVKPSDPLFICKMTGKLLGVDYLLTNATLVGFKNCRVRQTSLNETAMTYQHTLRCPKFIINYYFNAAEKEINSKGYAVITTGVYEITISGKFGQFISKEDQKPHLFLKTYYIKTNAIGMIVFEGDDYYTDEEKGKQILDYLDENQEILVEFFDKPIMKECMAILLRAVNKVLRTLPIDKVFPKLD